MKYSIITVSLNPGESLKKTLDSIKAQTYPEYEVIIKDGGSTDNSLAAVPKDMRYRIIYGTDKGIYDAMNMAVKGAVGDVVIFLNAGDLFYDEHVLEKMTEKIEKAKLKPPFIAYGDMFSLRANTVVKASSKVTPMVCYNYIACHQATLYSIDVVRDNPFDIRYKIRAEAVRLADTILLLNDGEPASVLMVVPEEGVKGNFSRLMAKITGKKSITQRTSN